MTREEYLEKRRAYYQKNKHKWAQYAKEHREQKNAYNRERYRKNPEKYRAMKKAWREKNVEKNKEYQKRYREKEGYKEKKRAYYEAHKQEFFERAKRKGKRYSNERKAQRKLWNAIKRGDIVQRPCEVCGSAKADAHHPDYNKPLERCVMTDCGDPYMDYGISFDELSEIMEKIKVLDKKGNV